MPEVIAFEEDFGDYADTAAFLATWSAEVDPDGIATWDLDSTHVQTSSTAARVVVSGVVGTPTPYNITRSRTVSGLSPNTGYRLEYMAYRTGTITPNDVWTTDDRGTVTSDASGNATIELAVSILAGSPSGSKWFDRVRLYRTVSNCDDPSRTSIAWTDSIGSACLTNGMPYPADRFAGWTPNTDSIGPRTARVGSGIIDHVSFRTDYLATFALEYIPRTSVALAQRLIAWLDAGNTCRVNTGDRVRSSYTVRIAPGTRGELEMMPDRRLMEYVLRLTVKNTAAAPLNCVY